MQELYEVIKNIGIIPTVKIEDACKAVTLAQSLKKGGIPVIEITYRTDAAEEAIRQISKNCPDILLGAGTVISIDNAKSAVSAGAKFLVSPGFNCDVVDWCIDNGVTIIPGVSSPSEIEMALSRNIRVLKLFPSEVLGGVNLLDAFAGPYSHCMFVPTGGINTQNLGDYARRKNVIAVGGTWMVKSEYINDNKWDTITRLCIESIKNLQGFKMESISFNSSKNSEAEETLNLLGHFGFEYTSQGSVSMSFADKKDMPSQIKGSTGQMTFSTNNVERAISYLSKFGLSTLENTIQYSGKSNESYIKSVFLDKEINGFAICLKKN